MNLTAIQSKVTRGNYVNVKKSVILSAEKEQPAENKVTGQQSEVTRPVHTIVSDSSAANPVRDKLQSESEQIQDDGVKDCLLYTSPSPRDISGSRMPSSA